MPTHRNQIPADWVAVLVQTDRRVIFGWMAPIGAAHAEGGVSYVVNVLRARNAVRWGEAGGVAGLALRGPAAGAVLEAAVDIQRITGVVSIRFVEPDAIEGWESWPAMSESRE